MACFQCKTERDRIVHQEQENSILSKMHEILAPFLLRRVKADVDIEIPPKKEVKNNLQPLLFKRLFSES